MGVGGRERGVAQRARGGEDRRRRRASLGQELEDARARSGLVARGDGDGVAFAIDGRHGHHRRETRGGGVVHLAVVHARHASARQQAHRGVGGGQRHHGRVESALAKDAVAKRRVLVARHRHLHRVLHHAGARFRKPPGRAPLSARASPRSGGNLSIRCVRPGSWPARLLRRGHSERKVSSRLPGQRVVYHPREPTPHLLYGTPPSISLSHFSHTKHPMRFPGASS